MSLVPDALREQALRVADEASLLSVRLEMPAREAGALSVFESAPSGAQRFYWEQPSELRAIAASGATECIEASGDRRFETSAAQIRALLAELRVASLDASAPPAAGPMFVGGFGFESSSSAAAAWEGFAPLSFVLPALCYAREAERAWLTSTLWRRDGESPAQFAGRGLAALEDAARRFAETDIEGALLRAPSCASAYTARPDRPHAVYLGAVETAAAAIQRGDLEKVVLARSLEVESDVAYDPGSVLASLRRVHGSSTVFAVGRGERVFLGASPERLVAVEGEAVRTAAVAGSAPRGRSPEEDERHGRALRESKKEQEEHAVVVREIEAALQPLCDEIEHPESPALLKLDGIQHLQTLFRARLRETDTRRPHLLEIADRLHPTPAVGGTPRAAARDWIREREDLERGWYAGGIGFVTADGGGELHVGLRSGLLGGDRARLYAGAGIVSASVPEAELAETRLKLRTLLSQLTEI